MVAVALFVLEVMISPVALVTMVALGVGVPLIAGVSLVSIPWVRGTVCSPLDELILASFVLVETVLWSGCYIVDAFSRASSGVF